MKRILCLIESLDSGGAERQMTGLAVMLKQQGYHVEVWYYVRKEFYLGYLTENGVVGRYLKDVWNPNKRYFALKGHINKHNPDTVISYSASTSMITCLMKLLGARFNLIVSERNTTQDITNRIKLRFFLYAWADLIVPNSFAQKDFIDRNFPGLAKKVNVITNFVDLEKFSPIEVNQQKDCGLMRITCVGRVTYQKNIIQFICVVAKLISDGYKIQVDWFGHDLKDVYSDECHRLLDEHNLSDIFKFHAPSSEIQEEYRKADVFCLPSLYEGFPNVVCEAMSCGKPVLCSNVCDNANIVKDGVNGFLFDPLDIDNMAETIERYIGLSAEEKEEMGRKNRERALELFSEEKFISKYMKMI